MKTPASTPQEIIVTKPVPLGVLQKQLKSFLLFYWFDLVWDFLLNLCPIRKKGKKRMTSVEAFFFPVRF